MDYHARIAINYTDPAHNIIEFFDEGDLDMKSLKHRRARRIILSVLLSGVIVAVALAAYYLAPYANTKMDMSLMDLPAVNRPARLLTYAPALRAERSGPCHDAPNATLSPPERRVFVPYQDLPEDLIHAFVAIEDKRFYEHGGVDWLRSARAALQYIMGDAAFGGSTITQQVVKNLTGHDEPTKERKLTEMFCAIDMEKHATKEEILECYLNIINLAKGCRGVGAAAECYFFKTVGELTLAECATIAAITQNPAKYDPIAHPAAAEKRRDLILYEMEKQGYISESARDSAIAEELCTTPGTFGGAVGQSSVASWYADMVAADVITDLMERLGYTYTHASRLLYSGGLTIETCMDEELQAIVEAYYADTSHFPAGEQGRPQSSLILIDPFNGDILAVAGAVGEKSANRIQNYATDTRRPAGSCIKPLSLFAPAIEEGRLTWATVYDDEPLEERGGVPWPRNADGLYRGRVSAGYALAESLNPVAVRILADIGEDTAYSYLKDRFGISSLRMPAESAAHDLTVSSLALGQQSRGVTTRELTAAYTAFYDGVYSAPISYYRVLDMDGKVLLENDPPARRAVSPETAALMTQMLRSVTEVGTAAPYLTFTHQTGIACAGKTGTTQNNCDRRYVGYTPRLLAGVWMGYDYPSELRGIRGNPCISVWDDVMTLCESVYKGREAANDFPENDLIELDFCPLSGALPNPYCTGIDDAQALEHGLFIPGTEPRDICRLHEEPPIITLPEDPSDPDRIPLLPNDILPEAPPAPPAPEQTPWFARFRSKWFTRNARRPKI